MLNVRPQLPSDQCPCQLGAHDDLFEAIDQCLSSACPCKVPVAQTTEICGQSATLALIHVGKTGGSTVQAALEQAGIPHTTIHLGLVKPKLFSSACAQSFNHFVFTSRDPVARAISAFNWHSQEMLGPVSIYPGPLWSTLYEECFPTANTYAEAMGEEGKCGDLARKCTHEPPELSGCGHISGGPSSYTLDTGVLEV